MRCRTPMLLARSWGGLHSVVPFEHRTCRHIDRLAAVAYSSLGLDTKSRVYSTGAHAQTMPHQIWPPNDQCMFRSNSIPQIAHVGTVRSPDATRPRRFSSSIRNDSMWRTAYIALGSNVGDRLSMIETACRMLGSQSDIKLLKTSSLYETEPMYVEDQGPFLNGACKVGLGSSGGQHEGISTELIS